MYNDHLRGTRITIIVKRTERISQRTVWVSFEQKNEAHRILRGDLNANSIFNYFQLKE